MATIDKDEEMISLNSKQMEQLRKELREAISREELGQARLLEALDLIITVSQKSDLPQRPPLLAPIGAQ